MTDVEAGLDELEEVAIREDWALALVQEAAFAHVFVSPACVSSCHVSSGRAICGECEWQISARIEDVGERRSAVFAYFVLGAIGVACARGLLAAQEALR